MKMLVPIYDASFSLNAAEKAFEIAEAIGAELKFVAIIKKKDIRTYTRYTKICQYANGSAYLKKYKVIDNEKALAIMKIEASLLLETITDKLSAYKSKIEKDVLVGNPYSILPEIAKSNNCDFIVICNKCSSQYRWFAKQFRVQRLICNTSCSILFIKNNESNATVI